MAGTVATTVMGYEKGCSIFRVHDVKENYQALMMAKAIKMKDCIKIRKLKVFAYHGCMEEEKKNGQDFYVDVNMYTDITNPGYSDELDDTVNYALVCSRIKEFMTKNRFDLIEAVAVQCS